MQVLFWDMAAVAAFIEQFYPWFLATFKAYDAGKNSYSYKQTNKQLQSCQHLQHCASPSFRFSRWHVACVSI